MKHHLSTILLAGGMTLMSGSQMAAQIYSFEDSQVPQGWSLTGGSLETSSLRNKLGKNSLHLTWTGRSVLSIDTPAGIEDACKARSGGLATWVYNENPIDAPMIFLFQDKEGKTLCQLSFNLNFKGWRCIWSKFKEDMGLPAGAVISAVKLKLPTVKQEGSIYLDYLEFSKNVSWQKMSDLQYTVNHKDFSLIHNFIGYRNMNPDLTHTEITAAKRQGVNDIHRRLTNWYLGEDINEMHPMIQIRTNAEKAFIQKGVKSGNKIKVKYNPDGTPAGEGLFPLYAPSKIDGTRIQSFMHINRNILLPLALDYRKNDSQKSLNKATYIYDWFNDQGWADGSGMGTLCFEKLRSAGYFHSFFLLKDELTKEQYDREVKNLKWMTLFGHCYEKPEHAGEVADNLRALALPKLIYALSLDGKEQMAAMEAFTAYMNNALSFGPGFFGTIKPDYSGYHHRGAYNSAYYPHALYAASLMAYLLHDTPYALSAEAMNNLKQALLTFRFFSADLSVPAATTGRFPTMQKVLQHLVPAYAYVALASEKPDEELIAAMKRIYDNNRKEVDTFFGEVDSNLTYTASLGEAECVLKALYTKVKAEQTPVGSLFMPYSGLMVVKNKNHHFNIKGYSRYIWDYECSTTENLFGRYISYGQIEHFNLKTGDKSYHASNPAFDWNYIPGTTAKVLPKEQLKVKDGMKTHRSFSDETFLSGVSVSENRAMFSFKLHDLIYDKSFRANKSVFAFDGMLLCMGSNIQNNDQQHETVTTLLQAPAKISVTSVTGGDIVSSKGGMMFAVKGESVKAISSDDLSVAYINHGTTPASSQYTYFILPDGSKKEAKKLLSEDSPVRILQQDDKAHLVEHTANRVVYGALFDEKSVFAGQLVQQVNIPLSYILEHLSDKTIRLSLCEPDMRRISRETMDKLSEKDVIDVEKPFETQIILKGIYTLKGDNKDIKVEYKGSTTILTLSTIRGENYQIDLTVS